MREDEREDERARPKTFLDQEIHSSSSHAQGGRKNKQTNKQTTVWYFFPNKGDEVHETSEMSVNGMSLQKEARKCDSSGSKNWGERKGHLRGIELQELNTRTTGSKHC